MHFKFKFYLRRNRGGTEFTMANYFPFYLNVEKRPILIFGGGGKAYEKIEKLLPYGPSLTVAAEKVTPTIKRLGDSKKISLVRSNGTDAQALISRLSPMLVIIADVDEDKIESVFKVCRKNKVEVCTADRKEYSTFLFPSVIQRKNFSVAVSTFGASPAAAKWIRDQIERALPAAVDNMMEHFSTLRRRLAERGADLRSGPFATMYREFLDTALSENRMLTASEMADIMSKYIEDAE
jgi:siroheme synthase-like protein